MEQKTRNQTDLDSSYQRIIYLPSNELKSSVKSYFKEGLEHSPNGISSASLEGSAGSLAESIIEEEKDASASLTDSASAGGMEENKVEFLDGYTSTLKVPLSYVGQIANIPLTYFT
ncbi:hypothetical protein C5167_012777 [Papaver somniferum]|uniref:Uncharacterized protein n=1 Tax=Papaver somniferum TaxID=3469 RepID=A0A4Y7J2E4_PAPSO|nr:hypothetical protein C5167_012777 [Papaver somniferum]